MVSDHRVNDYVVTKKTRMPELKIYNFNDVALALGSDEKGLYLQLISNDPLGPVRVDFVNGPLGYRLAQLKKELIAKAVGIKGDYRPTIIDATAGFGRDAFLLASLGCDVIAVEKNPIVAALLKDGLKRAAHLAAAKRIHVIESDSLNFIQQLKEKPDIIYCDPMFPLRKKSAKVQKEMRVLEAMLGQDDATELVALALKQAKKRVVVKRPKNAKAIIQKKPDIIYEGKTIRFDVYFAAETNIKMYPAKETIAAMRDARNGKLVTVGKADHLLESLNAD